MNFNRVDEKNFNALFLHKISKKEKADEQSINNYLRRYNAYRELLTQYLIEKLDLLKYDSNIAESELKFIPVNPTQMDVYQYFTANYLKYFYIRNNIYIEKLSQEELTFLDERLEKNELSEEDIKYIESTYKKLIFEDVTHDGRICRVLYGPNSPRYLADNNSLIIGIRYNKFKKSELDEDEWINMIDKQEDYLDDLIKKMKENIKEKNIDIPISIMEYNEFSIIPKL